MPIADIAYLQAHDDPDHLYSPPNWDGSLIGEVDALGPLLSEIAGCKLESDFGVQDATFLADWRALEEIPKSEHGGNHRQFIWAVCVRFSNFGRMAAIYSGRPEYYLREPIRQRLIDCLDNHGFVYVPEHLLEIESPHPRILGSWQIRYFDWV